MWAEREGGSDQRRLECALQQTPETEEFKMLESACVAFSLVQIQNIQWLKMWVGNVRNPKFPSWN